MASELEGPIDPDDLTTIRTPLLVRIWAAKHELLDGYLGNAIVLELWRRHEQSADQWPLVAHSWIPAAQSLGYLIEERCSLADSPIDQRHQPASRLALEGFPAGFRCSCGAQTAPDAGRPRLWWRRLVVRADREPITVIDPRVWLVRGFRPDAVYHVCPKARAPYDPYHALYAYNGAHWCICGVTEDTFKEWPVA